MNDLHFLAVKSLSQKTTRSANADLVLLNVMKHNLREILAEIGASADSKIDPSRSHENILLHGLGTSSGAADMAQVSMREAGVTKIRKNATLGIECIFSLPVGLQIDYEAYFQSAMRWSQSYFDVQMLSAVIHKDEDYPHLHVVMLPIRDGRLIGSELLGDRTKTKAMHKNFHEQVGRLYGLRQPKPQKRLSASIKRLAIDSASDVLKTNSGLNPDLLKVLLTPHLQNPEPLMLALGLPMLEPAPAKGRTFVGIMTAKVKSEKPNRRFGNSLIGDLIHREQVDIESENTISYALLGHCKSTPSTDITETQKTIDSIDRYTRECDTETASKYWDADRGEFVKPPDRVRV